MGTIKAQKGAYMTGIGDAVPGFECCSDGVVNACCAGMVSAILA